MCKLVGLSIAILLLFDPGMIGQQQLTKYRKIEAYEVRPGILMMPKYTSDNQICEVGLQRLQYSPEHIRLDSLSSQEIDQILDEVAPTEERGKRSNSLADNLVTQSGSSMVMITDFENVTLEIYGSTTPSKHKGFNLDNLVATIKWKNRVCR